MTALFTVTPVLWLSNHACSFQFHKPGWGLSGKLFPLLTCCLFLRPNLHRLESRSYWHIYICFVFWLTIVLFVRALIHSLFSLTILWTNIVFTIFIWFFVKDTFSCRWLPSILVVTFQIIACIPGIVVKLLV